MIQTQATVGSWTKRRQPDAGRGSVAGHQEGASRHTRRRLARYRTGTEGRITQLKRRYGLDRSRLKGDDGEQIWTEWAILTYNADTLAVRGR